MNKSMLKLSTESDATTETYTTSALDYVTSNLTDISATNVINTTPSYGYSINTTSPILTTWNDCKTVSSSVYEKEAALDSIITVLNEAELEDLASKLANRKENNSKFLRQIIRNRHVSEAFIMKYIDIVNVYDILVMHEADIKSGQYPNLALYFELNNIKY